MRLPSGRRCLRWLMAALAQGTSRRAVLLASLLVLTSVSCTYADREPGLFERAPSEPPRTRVSSPPPPSLPAPNPALPVTGDTVWTSADGLQVEVRIAVHAVRRVAGGTVLDWSLTPLRAPNLRPGDLLPEGFELGLADPDGGAPAIYLIDAGAAAVYRPLTTGSDAVPCLCTPIAAAQRTLRIGVTTLQQIAYPRLPAGTTSVDVSLPTVPPFWNVAVTPTGRAPRPTTPTDLTRPAPVGVDPVSTAMFRYGPDEQVFRFEVERVIASSTFTALQWSIVSVTGGSGVETASAPPFTDGGSGSDHGEASGPVLRLDDRKRLSPQTIGQRDQQLCHCTDLRGWPTVLRRPDKLASVVTSFPPLPAGTRQVAVVFAGHPPLTVEVTAAAHGGRRTPGTVATRTTVWRLDPAAPIVGWQTSEWPTPAPSPDQLQTATARVDRLR